MLLLRHCSHFIQVIGSRLHNRPPRILDVDVQFEAKCVRRYPCAFEEAANLFNGVLDTFQIPVAVQTGR